jgi:hypothetical protein
MYGVQMDEHLIFNGQEFIYLFISLFSIEEQVMTIKVCC